MPGGIDIGTVEVDSPPLAEPLIGDVYVGEQKSTDPESGEQFRILVEAKSENEGIVARLVGNVKANPTTGQLTAVFDDQLTGEFAGKLPRGPAAGAVRVGEAALRRLQSGADQPADLLGGGDHGQFEPWARPGEPKPVSAQFTLTSDPSGGTCPTDAGRAEVRPGLHGQSPTAAKAGAYSPFRVHIGRPDGQQELKVVNVTLPKGLTGKLAGIPYCSEAAIAAAAAKQRAKPSRPAPSCPAASLIGTVTTEVRHRAPTRCS